MALAKKKLQTNLIKKKITEYVRVSMTNLFFLSFHPACLFQKTHQKENFTLLVERRYFFILRLSSIDDGKVSYGLQYFSYIVAVHGILLRIQKY